MVDNKLIQSQLFKFNQQGFADPNIKYLDNGKNGKILSLTDGDWRYEDEFYGGEPYSGNETIWYQDSDIFRCVYWGCVQEGIGFTDIYDFLRIALKQGPSGNCVHRGPESFTIENMTYTNTCSGTIENFQQTERIFLDGKEVYVAYFFGGLINVQKE